MGYIIQIAETENQPVLSVRTKTSVENLPNIVGEVFGSIAGYIAANGDEPLGPAFIAYYNLDVENLEVEIGFPVAREMEGKAEINLFDMTRHLNVSISHFTNQFKEFTGKTFIEYLTAKRIDVAKHKLKHTDLMLYRIASDVGYENPTYFASIFKKYVGIAPTQYRKLYQQRDARQTTR